jgi:hypothetical protein
MTGIQPSRARKRLNSKDLFNMINQIIAWWVNNFSPRLEGNPPPFVNLILSSMGITGTLLDVMALSEYLGFGERQYIYLSFPLALITIAFSSRVVTQFYIAAGNTIAQKCNHLSTMLLNYHDLQPNPTLDVPIPGYMSGREAMLASLFCLIGGASGIFASNATLYSFLRVVGLSENLNPVICYAPVILLGAVPGCVFGFTTGRLVEHVPEIISKRLKKRLSYQQARAIITLNDLPSNLNQNRHLPPEILAIIHSYIIGTSEQVSTHIINEVIDESNTNICSLVNNKICFFAQRYRQPPQLIESIEDEFESTPLLSMYHMKNS